MNGRFKARKVAGIILLVVLGVFVFGSLVMVLWNGLMPMLFHLPVVNFWQALGLFALAKLLFGGFRGGFRGHWRGRLNDRWMNMTPEEREKFKQEWGRRCGGRSYRGGPFGERAPFPTDTDIPEENK
jgi:hypothetical protein